MLDQTQLIAALAENRRMLVVSTKTNPLTASVFSDSFAYAVAHGLYPLYQEDINDGPVVCGTFEEASRFIKERGLPDILCEFPFFSTYRIGYAQVIDVISQIDEEVDEISEDTPTLASLLKDYQEAAQRSVFNGAEEREGAVANICRYLYLNQCDRGSRHHYAEFWEHFVSEKWVSLMDPEMTPRKANWIVSDFHPRELTLPVADRWGEGL